MFGHPGRVVLKTLVHSQMSQTGHVSIHFAGPPASGMKRRLFIWTKCWLRPHTTTCWSNCAWLTGGAIRVVSKPHAEKVQDMRADPRVMVALGNAEDDFDVGLIEARAELLDTPAGDFLPESHWRKYARDLAGIGLTREGYVATYSQSIRIVPVRYLGWRGRSRPEADPSKSRMLTGVGA